MSRASNLGIMQLAKVLMVTGIGIFLLGVAVWVGSKIPGLNRLGNLPGDIHIDRGGFRFYFPWVTCLLLSLLLSVIFGYFRK